MSVQNITTIALPNFAIQEKQGMVILSLIEYEKIKRKIEELEKEKKLAVEEAEVLEIIAEGEREYKKGRLKPIKCLADLD